MRYPAEETAEKHRAIVEKASVLFRERGFDGVSVSEVMKATGLTHGAFYNHFESKDALLSEAIGDASDKALTVMKEAGASPEAMRAYIDGYLAPYRRDEAGRLDALVGGQTREGDLLDTPGAELGVKVGATERVPQAVLAGNDVAFLRTQRLVEVRTPGAFPEVLLVAGVLVQVRVQVRHVVETVLTDAMRGVDDLQASLAGTFDEADEVGDELHALELGLDAVVELAALGQEVIKRGR